MVAAVKSAPLARVMCRGRASGRPRESAGVEPIAALGTMSSSPGSYVEVGTEESGTVRSARGPQRGTRNSRWVSDGDERRVTGRRR